MVYWPAISPRDSKCDYYLRSSYMIDALFEIARWCVVSESVLRRGWANCHDGLSGNPMIQPLDAKMFGLLESYSWEISGNYSNLYVFECTLIPNYMSSVAV